jgi:hypothetical protein
MRSSQRLETAKRKKKKENKAKNPFKILTAIFD